jgi:hypothetical protein
MSSIRASSDGLSLTTLLFLVALSFDRVSNRFNSFGRAWKELAQLQLYLAFIARLKKFRNQLRIGKRGREKVDSFKISDWGRWEYRWDIDNSLRKFLFRFNLIVFRQFW